MGKSERKIQHEILVAVNKKFSDRLRLWRNNVGKGYGAWVVGKAIKKLSINKSKEAFQSLRQARPVQFGVKGSPDLQGFLQIDGLAVYLGIEVKREGGKQSDIQQKYEKMIKHFGGIYIVARSEQQAINQIQRIIDYYDQQKQK